MGILNLWIALPTKNTKLNVQQIKMISQFMWDFFNQSKDNLFWKWAFITSLVYYLFSILILF